MQNLPADLAVDQSYSMRLSARVLAKVSSRTTTPLPQNLQVLAPIALYRRLLRAHRKYLPPPARALGDEYVKAEFHRTKDTENPVHIIGFLTRWQVYCPSKCGSW